MDNDTLGHRSEILATLIKKSNLKQRVFDNTFTAFNLFKNRKLALFFIFAMAFGTCVQITSGYVTPYLDSFAINPEYSQLFVVRNSLFMTSLSQTSEAFLILLLPVCIKKMGIKRVITVSALAWSLRYLLLGLGNPADGVIWLILSMIVYGVAFNFFNIAGSMFVDSETDPEMRSSAQGLFMMMTNGFGASLGMLAAGWVMNIYTINENGLMISNETTGGWTMAWSIFAAYALIVAIAFSILFKYEHSNNQE